METTKSVLLGLTPVTLNALVPPRRLSPNGEWQFCAATSTGRAGSRSRQTADIRCKPRRAPAVARTVRQMSAIASAVSYPTARSPRSPWAAGRLSRSGKTLGKGAFHHGLQGCPEVRARLRTRHGRRPADAGGATRARTSAGRCRVRRSLPSRAPAGRVPRARRCRAGTGGTTGSATGARSSAVRFP